MTDDDIALLGEHLSDPIWRLTSGEIYRIKTADGRGIIPFIPRPEQVELLTELVEAVEKVRGRTKTPDTEPQDAPQNVELKARRQLLDLPGRVHRGLPVLSEGFHCAAHRPDRR